MIQTAIATAVLLAASFAAPSAPAAGFPDKPVTLVVPYPPGGATDTIARIVAKGMTQRLGQTVVVDNKAGAGTAIGAGAVAHAAPDGYTLLISSNTTFTVNPALKAKLPYDAQKSFESIGLIGNSPLVLLAQPSLPAGNVKELVALAKAKPGKLSYGSFGNGTTSHLAGEMFKIVTGTDMLHVPYKGSTGARNDIISGQIEMMFDSVPTMAQMVQAGRVKALGTTGKVRSAILPDVPTLAEAGVPGYVATMWVGVMAPAGTPQPIVDLLNAEINKVLVRPDVRAAWEKQGAIPMTMKPNEFGVYIQSEIEKWAKLINANAIKPE